MEFAMTGFHLAVIVAIVVTASLASNLLAIVAVGPARSTGALVRLRVGLRRSPRHAKRLVDGWVAAMLARRERQAATWASQRLHGRAGASSRDIRIRPGRPR
jgi:hypothetical protein